MKSYNNLFCTIQIISHKNNRIENNKIKKIHTYGYNRYFVLKKLDIFNSKIFPVKYIHNVIFHKNKSSLIDYWKKTGYVKMIMYIDFIHTKNNYQVINLKINPIVHRIMIYNYKSLKIPIHLMKMQFHKHIGLPINYFIFNNTIKLMQQWYIAKGFYWIKIKWKYISQNSQNTIKININEGEIFKIFIDCEDIIIDQNSAKQIERINRIIIKYLQLYKYNILNKNALKAKIYILQRHYGIQHLRYSIKYDEFQNKLIVNIKYQLLNIQYFSSYQLYLKRFLTHHIYNKIALFNNINFLNKKLIVYTSQSHLFSYQVNIRLILYRLLNLTQYKIYITYPALSLHKKFIVQYDSSINAYQYLSFLEYNQYKDLKFSLNYKKHKTNLICTYSTKINYNSLNLAINKYKVIFNPLNILSKYLKIYKMTSCNISVFNQYKLEKSYNLLNLANFNYKLIDLFQKKIYFSVSNIIIQAFIKVNYLNKYYILYLNNLIYLKYSRSIPIKPLKHDINLILKFCIDLHNQFTIPEYLLTRFYYDIQNSNRRYPTNVISLIYSQKIHLYCSIYYFLCYVPHNLHLYYTNMFFLHNYSVLGLGIKFNLHTIIKQMPQINIEYSLNSNKNIYFHIYCS